MLRAIVDAPGWVPNSTILKDIEIPSVRDEIRHHSHTYLNKLTHHPNEYAQDIISTLLPTRLKKTQTNQPTTALHMIMPNLFFLFIFYFTFNLFLIIVLIQNSQVPP